MTSPMRDSTRLIARRIPVHFGRNADSHHARTGSKARRFAGNWTRHRIGRSSRSRSRCSPDRTPTGTGVTVNNFWNSYTLIQTATDASFFAIMAIGATMVIISGGIDLSVGSIYALRGVSMALFLRGAGPMRPGDGAARPRRAVGVGLACGILNGALVVGLRVHPFIITLGSMWVLRGIAFVATKAESIVVPTSLTAVTKASLGLGGGLYPVPMLSMIVGTVLGIIYLTRTVMGRHIFAFGGNLEASRFAGLPLARIQIGVFAVSGLTAGFAAFLGASFYGSTSSGDAQGYELYVIASAVVGGASLDRRTWQRARRDVRRVTHRAHSTIDSYAALRSEL